MTRCATQVCFYTLDTLRHTGFIFIRLTRLILWVSRGRGTLSPQGFFTPPDSFRLIVLVRLHDTRVYTCWSSYDFMTRWAILVLLLFNDVDTFIVFWYFGITH